jgi:hypothetical protein
MINMWFDPTKTSFSELDESYSAESGNGDEDFDF